MKMLVIGCGGVGSWLIQEIAEAVRQEQIEPTLKFDIADNDMVELKQLDYQNFTIKDIGKNKAKILSERYKDYAFIYPIKERILKKGQLEGYDLIICCADNTLVRELLFRYCHENNKDFIDLRAEGRYIMAFQKSNLKTDLATLDLADKTNGSCQKDEDIERRWIQKGNKIVAMVGIQMLLNYLRGEKNNKILIKI